MDKCREAFEKLPEINAILRDSEFGFNESINQYYHPNHTEHRLNYAFLMGAWIAWQSRQAEVDRLIQLVESNLKNVKDLQEMVADLIGERDEKDKRIDTLITQIEMSDFKDKLIKELKDRVATYKIETYESHGRISYAHHCFMNMDRDQFYKNIEAIICGRLRHSEFSFDRSRIKALRSE